MISEQQRKLIDATLDRFDVNKVALVMETLEWQWWDSEEKFPQPHEIRQAARRLLEVAVRSSTEGTPYHVASGGLRATAHKESTGTLLTIVFEVETSEFDSEWLDEEPQF